MPRPKLEFRAQSRSLLRQLGIEEDPFIRGEAGMFAQALAKVTPPFTGYPRMGGAGYGTEKQNRQAGENAIWGDMRNIFEVRSRGYLEFLHDTTGTLTNVRRTLRRKDGTPYLVDVDEINYTSTRRALNFHESKRNSRGRTPSYSGDNGIGRWRRRDSMWITQEIWDEVYAMLKLRIGWSKAQLAEVAVSLGRPRPGKWVSRHMRMARVTTTSNPAVVTFTANGPGLDVPARLKGSVERFRITAMRMKLERMLNREIRRAGFINKLI
jgi:hypothetical protein